jgi:hypothetical protein
MMVLKTVCFALRDCSIHLCRADKKALSTITAERAFGRKIT